jgi:hypothetical protein
MIEIPTEKRVNDKVVKSITNGGRHGLGRQSINQSTAAAHDTYGIEDQDQDDSDGGRSLEIEVTISQQANAPLDF